MERGNKFWLVWMLGNLWTKAVVVCFSTNRKYIIVLEGLGKAIRTLRKDIRPNGRNSDQVFPKWNETFYHCGFIFSFNWWRRQ